MRRTLLSATLLLPATLLMSIAAAETLPADAGPMLRFTATTANVTGAPDSIRIDLFRWSTDAERANLMAAWELKRRRQAEALRAVVAVGAAPKVVTEAGLARLLRGAAVPALLQAARPGAELQPHLRHRKLN